MSPLVYQNPHLQQYCVLALLLLYHILHHKDANIHSHVIVEKGKAEVIFTRRNDDCECRCRTHFACKRCGYLHPYGVKCDRVVEEPKRNTAADEDFDKLMETWRESQKKEESKKPKEPTD